MAGAGDGPTANLHGHEAGNGGYSQGEPTGYRASPRPYYALIGYVLAGLPGAALATIAIFLPSFVFVAVVYPAVPRLRGSPWTRPALDGVNVAALGLMAAVTWQLGRSAIVDGLTAVMAALALALLVRFRINSAWLIAAGGGIGILSRLLAG